METGQEGIDAGKAFLCIKGLCQVVVGPGLERIKFIGQPFPTSLHSTKKAYQSFNPLDSFYQSNQAKPFGSLCKSMQ